MNDPNQTPETSPNPNDPNQKDSSVILPDLQASYQQNHPSNQGVSFGFEISTTSDPLPEPEKLQQYQQLGLLEVAIQMIQKEQDHRHQQEEREQLHRHQQEKQEQQRRNQVEQDVVKNDEKSINLEHRDRTLGQIFGLVIGLFTVGMGGYVAVNGSQWAGGFIGTGGVVSLAAVFVKGRDRAHLPEKASKSDSEHLQ